LEELDTFSTLSSVDRMGLEEVQEAGYSDILYIRSVIVRGGVTSPRASILQTPQPSVSPKAALYTPLTEHLLPEPGPTIFSPSSSVLAPVPNTQTPMYSLRYLQREQEMFCEKEA